MKNLWQNKQKRNQNVDFSKKFTITNNMVFIYVLQLKRSKYYIGKTNYPHFRIKSHFNSFGSEWTKKFKPTKLIKLIPNCTSYDEDKYTLEYMEKFGIDNVRGGSFCRIELSYENKKSIQQMIKGSTDKCYECGKEGHFAKDCELFTLREEVKRLNNELSTLKEKMKQIRQVCQLKPLQQQQQQQQQSLPLPPPPSYSKLNKTKELELLKMWCYEMSKDHLKFYLLGKEHYYVPGIVKSHPFPPSSDFNNFELALHRKGRYSLIYDTNDYKIYIGGLVKRNKKKEVSDAILKTLSTGKFEYVEI